MPIPFDSTKALFAAVVVNYADGEPESYFLPLAFVMGERAAELQQSFPQALITRLKAKSDGEVAEGILVDALYDRAFLKVLLDAISRRRSFKGNSSEIVAAPSKLFRHLRGDTNALLEPAPSKREQSNTSIVYGDRFILKMFRRWQDGVNPDLEIGRFLTEKTSFEHIPQLAGSFQLQQGNNRSATLGILQNWIRNEGDAWRYTLDHLGDFFENCFATTEIPADLSRPAGHPLDFINRELPHAVRDVIGTYLESVRLLGQRTGEFHVALAADVNDPDFIPEPFTPFYRRSAYQSMRTLADRALALLRDRLKTLPEDVRGEAESILALKSDILGRFRFVVDQKITALRIRCHGDYHLGQVLYTGKDFVITDFEGEPAQPLSERRSKRSPLSDVAGMLRSFDYAALSFLKSGDIRPEDLSRSQLLSKSWSFWVSVVFLQSYLESSRSKGFLPGSNEELKSLLDLYLLYKSVYELHYELNNRPDWISVPIRGIFDILRPAD